MIRTTNHGFHLIFDNGWVISVQLGALNYCDKYPHNKYNRNDFISDRTIENRPNAEIAIFHPGEDNWHTFENGDNVKGWVSADELAYWIEFTKNKPYKNRFRNLSFLNWIFKKIKNII